MTIVEERIVKILSIISVIINSIIFLFSLIILFIFFDVLFNTDWQSSSLRLVIFIHSIFYIGLALFFIFKFAIFIINKVTGNHDGFVIFTNFISIFIALLLLLFRVFVIEYFLVGFIFISFILELIISKINRRYYV